MTTQIPNLTPSNGGSEFTRYSSLDFVEAENQIRSRAANLAGAPFPSDEFPELRHDNFSRKVQEVLGDAAPRFEGTYVHPQNGQTYPCYYLPKRESCLMAMAYSYALQAKVFDRWQELENERAFENERVANTLKSLAFNSQSNAGFEAGVRLGSKALSKVMTDSFMVVFARAVDTQMELGGSSLGEVVAGALWLRFRNGKKLCEADAVTLRSLIEDLRKQLK